MADQITVEEVSNKLVKLVAEYPGFWIDVYVEDNYRRDEMVVSCAYDDCDEPQRFGKIVGRNDPAVRKNLVSRLRSELVLGEVYDYVGK